MLKSLSIENIAVIEKANIEFSDGLNVLTGETGAGKSIVVDSINAILGERTTRELVRHGTDCAVVTALFQDNNSDVASYLTNQGIDVSDDEILINRRITSNGKSICKINGCLTTVSTLRELGKKLVNIHGQHDSQELLNPDYHYRFLDMLSDDNRVFENYKNAFKNFITVRKQLKCLTQDADDRDEKLELLNFQIDELTKADLKIGEWNELKKRHELCVNSQSLVENLNIAYNSFVGDDSVNGIVDTFNSILSSLQNFAEIDGDLSEITNKLSNSIELIYDIKDSISKKLDDLNFDENELDKIEERLSLLYDFSKKYGETEEDMLNYLNDAVAKRNAVVSSDEEIMHLNKQYDDSYDVLLKCADALSNHRKVIAEKFENSVKNELEFLDMPNVQFKVNFGKCNLSVNGYDKIEFLISSNPGEPAKPLAKIASGGELSRIMLAIKNIIAEKDSISTLIFDEVDSGVSGRASRKIGYKLKSVSKHTQVICVTHSAQIAACADNHYLISKNVVDNKTYTSVNLLDFEKRKYELARIMGGIDITDTLLNSAEELLNVGI